MMFKWLHVAPLNTKTFRRLNFTAASTLDFTSPKPPAAAVVDFHCLIFSFLTRARRCLIASSLNLHGEM